VWDASPDNLAPIILSEWHNLDSQKFVVEGGSFSGPEPMIKNIHLRVLHSGKFLDVFEFSNNNGAPIVQFDGHDGLNQRWEFRLT